MAVTSITPPFTGSGDATPEVAVDLVGGISYQLVKLATATEGGTGVATSLPVTVSGVATAANQTTIIGHLDGVEGLLTTIDADTGGMAVSLALLDNLVLAEDAAHANGDPGVQLLAVRRDANTTLAASDNDYGPLQLNADGSLKVAITAGAGSGGTSIADDAAFTVGSTSLTPVGFLADETSTDSVDEGDAGVGRMTLDRKQIVVDQPHTQGGCSIFRSLDLDESEEEVKATRGQVYGVWFTNRATTPRYLKFYNATAANVTVGTTTPVLTIELPANASDHITGDLEVAGGKGAEFDTAITVAATTGLADSDTGVPAANDVVVNIFFK